MAAVVKVFDSHRGVGEGRRARPEAPGPLQRPQPPGNRVQAGHESVSAGRNGPGRAPCSPRRGHAWSGRVPGAGGARLAPLLSGTPSRGQRAPASGGGQPGLSGRSGPSSVPPGPCAVPAGPGRCCQRHPRCPKRLLPEPGPGRSGLPERRRSSAGLVHSLGGAAGPRSLLGFYPSGKPRGRGEGSGARRSGAGTGGAREVRAVTGPSPPGSPRPPGPGQGGISEPGSEVAAAARPTRGSERGEGGGQRNRGRAGERTGNLAPCPRARPGRGAPEPRGR